MIRRLHSISQILAIPMLLCAGAGTAAASPATTTTSIDVGVATLSNSQQVYTLTATVRSGNAAVSPGLITFYLNFTTPIGSAQLKSNGQAAIKVRIPLGEQALTASFNGTKNYASSTASQANVFVTGPRSSSSTTISANGSAGNYSVSAAVSAAGPQPPSGTVTFYDQTNGNYNLGGAALGASVSTLGFGGAANNPAGGSPQFVAVGDFNNDGIPDLVVTNSTDNNVGVFLGNADGTFQSQVTYATGPNPVYVVIGDFNSDGALDLAVVDKDFQTHGFSVLLGNGNGTFNGHTEYSIGILGYTPSAAAIGDFNNDGIPDIAVTTYSGNAVSVLLGNGSGGFNPPHAFPGNDVPVGIVAADFNGDGFADLAIADYFGVGVALGKGDGTFQTVVHYSTGTSPIAVAAGDFNNDGHIDLAVADSYDGTLNVLLGNGNGTFQTQTAYRTGSHPTAVAIADFNADGYQDLVVANNGGNNVGVLLGNGNGTFQTQTTYTTPAGPHGVAVGDFNGDVLPDIVTANTSGSASVLLNTATETATATASISVFGGGTHNIYVSWPGDASHQGSTSSTTAVQGKGISTTTTLSGPSSAVQQGLPVRLVATIQPSSLGNYSPSGSVTFTCTSCGANSALGSGQVSNASASLTTYSLPFGPNTIVAAYNGDSNFSGSGTNPITVTIVADGAPTQTQLSASASQAITGQSVQFTATVTSGGNTLTSGTVTFQENGATLFGPVTLNGTNTAHYTTSSLSEGIHSVSAVYNDPSNTYYPSSSNVSIEIDSPTVSPQSGEFCNNGGDSIGSSSGSLTASVYPSRVNVTNLAGTVRSVGVFLNNIYQVDPEQTAMLLQSPAGANLVFWEAAGGSTAPPSTLTMFFQDGNPYLTGAATSGSFSPTALDNSFVFPSPAAARPNYAPSAGSQTFTTAFQNINPNGYWSLFWANAFGSYPAQFSNWCLIVDTNPPVLAIAKSHTGSFTQGDAADIYTITVTNNGPGSTAGTLTLTDTLPAGLTATAMGQTAHSGGGTGSDWTCTVSTSSCTRTSIMPQGETDTILLTVSVASNAATGTNAVTNTATVTGASAAASDPTTINASNASVSFSTVPAGLSYSVDGTTYTSSQMLSLAAGPHTIAVSSPQTANGVQNTFASWSDNGAQSHQITVSSGSSSYVATFNTSYLLATSASPSNAGTVSPVSGTYYASGTVVNLTATPNTGYKFVNWTGNVTNDTVTMNAPQTVAANFAVSNANVSIQTSPSGLLVSVDNGAAQASPVSVSWQEGSSHTVATTSPQSATGTKYTFTAWSDSGALSHSITVAQGGGAYTASFSTAYLLTTSASPSNEGTVSPVSGTYYASGTVVNLTATPNTGYKFVNWMGNVTNNTVTMNAPQTVTANFAASNENVTIQTSPSGLMVSVDNGAAQAAPVSVSWQEGSSHTIATTSPQGSAGTRYTFSGWSDSGALSHSITVPQGGATYTATFSTSYQLTTSASPSNEGTVSPVSGTYYASGTVVNLTATPNTGYKFVNWTGNVTTNTVTMNAPQTVTANFAASNANVTIQTSPASLLVSVDNGAAQASPVSVSWQEGSSHTIATTSPQGSAGTRYTFSGWSDSGALSHSITVPQGGATYTATFSTSYQLTTSASPSNQGTVSPASGSYYASGTVVNLTATPNTGYNFVSWTGSVTNNSVTMNASQTVTANFAASNANVMIQTSPMGLLVSVDNGAAQASPVSVSWQQGSSHTIATTSPQGSAGTRYTFSGWSDSGALSHSITVPQGGSAYTANFSTSFLLTTLATPTAGGTVSPASDSYYASGAVVNLVATPQTGYAFAGWTANVAAERASTTVTMSSPQTVTALFSPVQVTATAFVYNRSTKTFNSTYTIMNTSGQTLAAPLQLVLTALPPGVTVANPSGTYQGNPFVTAPGSGPLSPGASLSVAVQFSDPSNGTISATPLVYSGVL